MKFTFFLFLFLPLYGFAQPGALGNWFIYVGNKSIGERWNWHHEAQYRNYDAIGDLEQLLVRTGLGYNLTEKNNNVLLGYGFILSENYLAGTADKTSLKEHRIYQQFLTRQAFGRFGVQHRYRFEQRFLEGQDEPRLRLRYFLALTIPLNHPTLAPNTWYLSAYNEIFLNTVANVFDRNRLYGGLGYSLSKNVRFEVGYMNQFLANGSRDQVNLIALVVF
jgi:hypothetical protein